MTKQQFQADLKQSMLAKNELKTSVLRLLLSAINYFEINKGGAGYEASEEDVSTVLQQQVKQRRDSIEQFKAGRRQDLVDKEQKELEILQTYLPAQMSEEEIRTIVKETITQTGASSMSDMGRVMGALMPKVKGRADGNLVSKIVKISLGQIKHFVRLIEKPMSLTQEAPRTVQVIRTGFRPLDPAIETPRVRQKQALDHELLVSSLEPNIVARLDIERRPWGLVNVLSPYTDKMHVMLIDLSSRYTPDPRYVPNNEGEVIMQTAAKIIQFQEAMDAVTTTSFGYNCSPRAYGFEEEKGGGQSVATKWHPMIWNEGSLHTVSVEGVPRVFRQMLRGNRYNRLATKVLATVFAQERFPFLNIATMETDSLGVSFYLNGSLSTASATPGFYSTFLRPVSLVLDALSRDVNEALTDLDFGRIDEWAKAAYEHGDRDLIESLREDPKLLPSDLRRKNIEALAEKGHPTILIDGLLEVNDRLENKSSVKTTSWVRKGFGYAFVLSQSKNEPLATMRIRPTIFVQDRGGVVEAQRKWLQRIEVLPDEAEAAISANQQMLHRLKEYLVHRLPNIIE